MGQRWLNGNLLPGLKKMFVFASFFFIFYIGVAGKREVARFFYAFLSSCSFCFISSSALMVLLHDDTMEQNQ